MSKSTFICGSMKSGKSEYVLDFILENKNETDHFIVFKPITDTRDGLFLKSRAKKDFHVALPWLVGYELMDYLFFNFMNGYISDNKGKITVVIDEVHFLSEYEISYINIFCKVNNINLICAGLLTSFKIETFEASDFCLEKFDEIVELKADCDICSEKDTAKYNLLTYENKLVISGESFRPGDEEYKVCCQECYDKYFERIFSKEKEDK